MDVTGCVEMNVLRISLIASLVFRSVGIACAYLVLMLISMRKYAGKDSGRSRLGPCPGHYCGFAQVDPFEKRGDDSQRLDNSNAMVHDDMNPLVLSYSHL